jgi:UDP-glucoronosyl and UDP-glucosyl transferase
VPALVEVGGMHVASTNQKLPTDIQQFLDDATEGAVYFSMGSNLRSDFMSKDKIQQILAAFAKLPQRILWKWESTDLPDISKNVKVAKWMPQQDILGGFLGLTRKIIYWGLISSASQRESIYHTRWTFKCSRGSLPRGRPHWHSHLR